jgi:hypothetical protein
VVAESQTFSLPSGMSASYYRESLKVAPKRARAGLLSFSLFHFYISDFRYRSNFVHGIFIAVGGFRSSH